MLAYYFLQDLLGLLLAPLIVLGPAILLALLLRVGSINHIDY